MSFFPPPTDPPVDTRDPNRPTTPRWFMPPRAELPGRVPFSALLARTDEVALVLTEAEVHADGCLLRFEWTLRRGNLSDRAWQSRQAAFSSGRHLVVDQDPSAALRLGVELADGQRLIVDDRHRPWTMDDEDLPDGHVVQFHYGSGSGDEDLSTQKASLWLWPLPPPGPLTLVFEWPAFSIAQTEFQVDATVLRSAAERTRPLWD